MTENSTGFLTKYCRLRGVLLALQILGTGAAYYAASELGMMTQSLGGSFWPPSGVALFALLRFGLRAWPGIMLGSLPLEVTLYPSFLPALGCSIGDTLTPVCAFLLLRWVGFDQRLSRISDALALVLLGAFLASLVNSAFGPLIMAATGQVPEGDFGLAWLTFYTGDVIGITAVVPLLLALRNLPRLLKMPWYAWGELTLMLALSFLVPYVAIRFNVSFLAFLVVAWAALRYRLIAVAPCTFLIALVTATAATRGIGSFAGVPLVQRMVELQMFNGFLVLGGLFFAVIIGQRDIAWSDIDHTCHRLSDAINHLEARKGTLQRHAAAMDLAQTPTAPTAAETPRQQTADRPRSATQPRGWS